VQVDPMRPTLKPPRSKRLKLRCVVPLSNFAFKFDLRRHNEDFVACGKRYAADLRAAGCEAGPYNRALFCSTPAL
jgi:hypothetical protein